LRNISGQTLRLYDELHPTNAWQIRGAVQFSFAPGTSLSASSYVIIVGFDPAQDPASLAWFRNHYGLGPEIQILGPFEGHLANEGERVGLYMPDTPEVAPSPTAGLVPYVLVEEVHYSNELPWPTGTLNTGNSLQRIASAGFGDDPVNWQAAAPSP